MSIWKWLGLARAPEQPEIDGVGHIEQALGGLEPARARYIACFAFILTRAARADSHISDAEAHQMAQIVALRADIPLEQAALVVAIARAFATRAAGTEDYLVTREFNAMATREQKQALLDCLFAVSAADASILTIEDNEIRRVANELKLEHGDYIAIRAGHREHLEVLRRGSDGGRTGVKPGSDQGQTPISPQTGVKPGSDPDQSGQPSN